MALITSENRDSWQQLANDMSAQFPSVGKRVRVTAGRKHLGKVGIVRWHGPDKFANNYYKSDAQLMLRDMRGRDGFRVRVESDGELFFISADKVEVLVEVSGSSSALTGADCNGAASTERDARC